MTPPRLASIGVVGAGAMGSGIAHVALTRGHTVVLADSSAESLDRGRRAIATGLARDVDKGRLTADHCDAALRRLTLAPGGDDLTALSDCGLVIEAVIEQLAVKQAVMRALEAVVADGAVLATNTSSLSVASVAAACRVPERVVGLHFFNPAPVMPLVEIVPGVLTRRGLAEEMSELMTSWQKLPVTARDTPGFIVNRIARPFYGEGLRIADEGIASPATIDWAMRSFGAFRMGPFELMDFIGHDVNYVVTESVWTAMYYDPRYRPSITQKRLLEAGLLGRKSGRGFYDHRPGAVNAPPTEDETAGRRIVRRIVAMLINEAVDAVHFQVASPAAIEIAMTKGVNYPQGLLGWGDRLGWSEVLSTLDGLRADYGEERYRASPLLRRMAASGTRFFE